MERHEHEARKQAILEYLATLPIEEWMLLRLANKVERCFSDNPVGALRAFAENGWGPSDIFHWLTNNLNFRKINPHWSDSFYHIFFVEHLLVETGLSKETAHSMVLTQAWIFWIPPVRLETAVKTFLELGYDEEIIKHIANQMPHMFHMPATEIIDECKRASIAQRGLLWNTKLDNGPPRITIKAAPIQISARIDRRAPLKIEPVNNTAAVVTSTMLEPEKPVSVDSVPAPRVVENRTMQTELLPQNLKPLKTFRPELTPELISKLRSSKPGAKREAVKEVRPKAEIQATEDLSPLNPQPLKTFRPAPNPNIVPKPAPIKEHKNRAHIGETEPENATPALDMSRIQALIDSSAKEDDDKAWKNYLEQNSWLNDKTSKEYQVCLILARWLPIHVQAAPYHLAAKGTPSDRLRFWVKVLTDKKIRKILLVASQTLEIRLYVLRRVGRNFLKEPYWLLLPWETLSERELRYRINEIEARGKNAHLKPYIKMLLNPDRAQFVKRLDDFVERVRRQKTLFLDELWDNEDSERLIFEDEPAEPQSMTPHELRAKLLAR
jgi:predicted DCC family thiol-disulfide oxidoreductase YuxK